MRRTSAWRVVLGVAAVTLPALVACRGVLGIHALAYDGGASDARGDAQEPEDAPSGDDAASESGPADTGVDAGHPVDTGVDAPKDAGADQQTDGHTSDAHTSDAHTGDAHEAGPVDAAKDAPKDAGHDGHPPPPTDASYDACVNGCITTIETTDPNQIGALIANCPSPCACPGCTGVCGAGGTCSAPADDTPACQTCLIECMRAGQGTNVCGMAFQTCSQSGSGCQMLGGCLNMCNP